MTKTTIRTLLITLFVLYLVEFFHLFFFPYKLFLGTLRVFFFLLPIFLLSRTKVWEGEFLGKKLFIFYLVFSLINMISCFYFREQGLYISFIAWSQLFYVLYYLTFRTWRQPIIVWEKVIENIYIVLLIIFALKNAFLDWDFVQTDLSEDRLEVEKRVRIYSDAFLELGYLFCLNKYLILKNSKYLLLSILGALFIFLQGFRIMIAIGIFLSFIMYARIYKLSLRSFILLPLVIVIILWGALQLPIVKDRIGEIVDRNENANFSNDDYVRVKDLNYTYNHFFQNSMEMFLGAGRTPFWNLNKVNNHSFPSKYSKERTQLASFNGYYPVDLGFLGLSWETGIPFTVVIILLFLYLWKIKVEQKYIYIKYYGLYMILIGGTNAQGYYQANLICLAIAYTIVELANKSYKKKKRLIESSYINEGRNINITSK